MKTYRTQSGTILTERDLDRLANEAEAGYCVEKVRTGDSIVRCFKPMPCSVHGEEDAVLK